MGKALMTLEAPISRSDAPTTTTGRWGQLVCGLVYMVMIANLQYGWTLFVNPIDEKYHWGVPAIQVAFSVFIATETWLVPVEGWFVDRFGPRIVVAFGGIVVSVAWALDSFADSLVLLYAAAAIGGSVLVRFTALVSAMHSSGFRIGAGLRRA